MRVRYSFLVKRDDLIHPLISGNKWRKLTLQFQHFIENPQRGIITIGGPYSNHLLATASACQNYKISSIGYVRGDYHLCLNPILQACQALGMELRFLSNKVFDAVRSQPNEFLEVENLFDYLYIPMGGEHEMGEQGCREIVSEVKAVGPIPKTWLVAAGTGTTASGVLLELGQDNTLYVQPAISQAHEIERLGDKLGQVESSAKHVILPAHAARFGSVNVELIDLVRSFYHQTNILLDPLYNGKLLQSFVANDTGNNGDILLYHSGGLYGWKGIYTAWHKRVDLSFLPNWIHKDISI